MKKGLTCLIKLKDHELAVKHIETEKVIVPISSYRGCTNCYPICNRDISAIRTLDHFARKNYIRKHRNCPLRYMPSISGFSLKERSFYKKSIGLIEMNKIIDKVNTEDYR